MKKFILLTLILLSSLIGFSTENVVKDSLNNKLELSEKMYNDMKEVISGLSESLKIGAENVYTAIRSQQIVNSISNLIVGVILIVGLIIFGHIIKTADWSDSDSPIGIIGAIGFIIFSVLIVFSIVIGGIDTIITGFINPDFGAINYLLELVK